MRPGCAPIAAKKLGEASATECRQGRVHPVPNHHAQLSHLEEALEGPLLDSLTGQDVGELSASV